MSASEDFLDALTSVMDAFAVGDEPEPHRFFATPHLPPGSNVRQWDTLGRLTVWIAFDDLEVLKDAERPPVDGDPLRAHIAGLYGIPVFVDPA